jgi:hypothetical protein
LSGNAFEGAPKRYRDPYRDNTHNFREEAKRAWTILRMYEAVLNRDWIAAKSLLTADESYGGVEHWTFGDSPDMYLWDALSRAAHTVGDTVGELCRPALRFAESSRLLEVDPSGVERIWWFDNLLGAAYLQMYWLMTSGGNITRCEYCGQVISLAKPNPDGRKRRRDKRFCDDACRQAHHRSKNRAQNATS